MVFRSLRADNIPESAEHIQRIVDKYARHVKQLNFTLYLNSRTESLDLLNISDEAPYDNTKESTFTVSNALPLLWELLSRAALPNVDTVRLDFNALPPSYKGDEWNDNGAAYNLYFDPDEDTHPETEMEKGYPWRALYNKALQSLTSGGKLLERLELCKLPPKSASAMQSTEWEKLLNEVEVFELSIWGGNYGDEYQMNTVEGYLPSVAALQQSILRHLTKAEAVSFSGHWAVPIGVEGQSGHTIPLPLKPDALPQVEHLMLENCFLDKALLDCLGSKPNQLKSLALTNCHACSTEPDRDGAPVYWDAFLKHVRETQTGLRDFSLGNRLVPLTYSELFHPHGEDVQGPFDPEEDDEEEDEDVSDMRRLLETNIACRTFSYLDIDPKYGTVEPHTEMILDSIVRGADQKEFDLVEQMVDANKRRSAIEMC